MENLGKKYDPKEFENKVYDYWLEREYFKAEVDPDKKPYTIMMPPPNVTGNLHMGHALGSTIQDILIRFKRMQGYSALWLPGTDHASISTESKVVEKIRSEGKSKEELGREKFLEEAWAWTEKYGGNIKNQLKKLGVSCDWSRDRFTLDEMLSHAVEEVFFKFYEKGLIYRGDRIINWCPSCLTAISDAEVEHEEADGHIWYFRYPFEDGSGSIEIATTRPETIPGDLAVAVNPEDERYKDLIGKNVLLPVMDFKPIPIIADEYVEMDFGSGAVKITPSHDPNDFEVGARHDLGQLKIMTDDAHLNENAGEFAGMERYEARRAIIEKFKELGYFVKEEHHHNAIGHCERCSTVIEPIISKQYFVKMQELAKPALEAYQKGDLKLVPDRFGKVYEHWLENIRDWCISRQLWWGHRIPVWYDDETGEAVLSRKDPSLNSEYAGRSFTQDPDTLDTWFSSALWPFSTLGWPEKTEDLEYFFPTDVLVTGYDIIFFWVIRMVFSSLEQMGEIPFKDVLFTGLVRDSLGRKMSKSLNNGIDPLEIIEKYGADALRFTLVSGNTPGNDMRFYMERVEANRNFANKLWNATRFLLINLNDDLSDSKFEIEKLNDEDKWILTKLEKLKASMTQKLEKYDIGLAASEIYDFTWSIFCDWYIEMTKPVLYGEEDSTNTQKVILYVLENILKLLHPFMPFITEEIFLHLPTEEEALIISTWPKVDERLVFEEEEKNVEYLKNAITKIRNARANLNIAPSKKSKLLVYATQKDVEELLKNYETQFKNLAYASSVESISKDEIKADDIKVVLDGAEIIMPADELIDFKAELERLEKEEKEAQSELDRAAQKLNNKNFVDKAPANLVEKEREKVEKYTEILENIKKNIELIRDKI